MSAAVGEPAIVSNTQTIPADISGQMLDLDEDDDLEVYSKVKKRRLKTLKVSQCSC